MKESGFKLPNEIILESSFVEEGLQVLVEPARVGNVPLSQKRQM